MSAFSRALPKCRNCGGTGMLVLMNSWFIQDGLRRQRCGICEGSGRSTFHSGPESVAAQARLRARYAARAASPATQVPADGARP